MIGVDLRPAPREQLPTTATRDARRHLPVNLLASGEILYQYLLPLWQLHPQFFRRRIEPTKRFHIIAESDAGSLARSGRQVPLTEHDIRPHQLRPSIHIVAILLEPLGETFNHAFDHRRLLFRRTFVGGCRLLSLPLLQESCRGGFA
jgi:hypothetical protein